jgi:hypothetical protein
MKFQMSQIIGHQFKKCESGVRIDQPNMCEASWIHRTDDAGQLDVEMTPQVE